MKFKVGDKVKYIGDMSGMQELTGVVSKIDLRGVCPVRCDFVVPAGANAWDGDYRKNFGCFEESLELLVTRNRNGANT